MVEEEAKVGVMVVRIGVKVTTAEEFEVDPDLNKDRTSILDRRLTMKKYWDY